MIGPRARRAAVRLPVPRTLRARLIAGLLALLLLTCGGVALATTDALRHFLVARLDQQLSDTSGRYAASLEHRDSRAPGATGSRSDTRAQAPGTFGARLLDGRVTTAGVVDGDADDAEVAAGNAPADTDDLVQLTSTDQRSLAALPVDGAARSVHLSGLGGYRLRAIAGQDGDVLVTGLPLHPVEATTHQLISVELVVFGAALAAATAAGAFWIRLSLRPLGRVVAAAEHVGALPLANGEVELDVRVKDDDSRTEVGRVGAALNRMLGHIEDALAQRQAVEERLRAFAADASHELRTPVATVRGHAELALRHQGPMAEPVRHSLIRIDAESRRMGAIVEDLLLLARLDAGRPLAPGSVDLTRLALDCTDDARAAGPRHRWRLVLPEEPVTVPGDGDRLRQVVANLLTNARTHTPDGTEVTLTLGREEGRVLLTVTDTGPGVDPEIAPRVFERFVRGDRARARTHGSTGLGLAIVDAVVAAHGGTVALTSHPGKSTFTVALPSGTQPSRPEPAGA
ncbi:two-component sensor histidine kinase [Kitasatospora herbaricolor]|uniref:sensor histidine kinase n=1 Tax=Kitasatospora herbaricolor TaxID=68217 RepID=UPI0019C5050A|nr:HAMP domain-containing sensor histidine kinase [Kitasatospora herbaricolor]GGV35404.1 two-component sensor histidine kinase [Kitasatospora herbaricolor]